MYILYAMKKRFKILSCIPRLEVYRPEEVIVLEILLQYNDDEKLDPLLLELSPLKFAEMIGDFENCHQKYLLYYQQRQLSQ